MTLRRRASLFFGVAATATILAGVAAFACTNLATLNLSTATGKVGDTITVTGSSFAVARSGPVDPVVLQWNGSSGPVLATVSPDKAGNISATFTVPQSTPGYYVIVATQKQASNGADAYGTPARASFQVLGPNGQSVVQPTGSQAPANLASEPSSTGIIALTAGLGVLGLALFGAGFTAFVRQARRRDVPVTAPVRRD